MNFLEFLQSVPAFSEMNNDELEALERAMVLRDYAADHEFVREDEPGNDLFLVVEGEVSVSRRKREQHGAVELERLHPGDLFGLMALIDHSARTATCKASGPVRAASLPRSAFDLLYTANSPLAHHFLKIVARQLGRDLRTTTNAIRRVLFSHDEGHAQTILKAIISQYGGPERRQAERRKSSSLATNAPTGSPRATGHGD
jgi:CRP/FNR family cyclic AMP-dependent transcriptional regulator